MYWSIGFFVSAGAIIYRMASSTHLRMIHTDILNIWADIVGNSIILNIDVIIDWGARKIQYGLSHKWQGNPYPLLMNDQPKVSEFLAIDLTSLYKA